MVSNIQFDEKLLSALRQAPRVMVLTGAGVSKESGIPTFRETLTGLWAQYNPEELATRQAFQRNPKLVWEWYQWRRSLIAPANPNPGHTALVEMEDHIPQFTLATQNVDGMHQRAGSRRVLELHGNIMRNKCFDEDVVVETHPEDGQIPPHCPRCGGLLRPDVIWFRETLPEGALDEAFQAARESTMFFIVGTSGLVQPAASLPLFAKQAGAMVVEVNPAETPLSGLADVVIPHPSGEALPELVRQTWGLD